MVGGLGRVLLTSLTLEAAISQQVRAATSGYPIALNEDCLMHSL